MLQKGLRKYMIYNGKTGYLAVLHVLHVLPRATVLHVLTDGTEGLTVLA